MTVNELIAHLQELQDEFGMGDWDVHFQYTASDYWRTQVAPEVTEVEPGAVKHSDYHEMPKVTEFGDAECIEVVLLGGG